jgi:transposase
MSIPSKPTKVIKLTKRMKRIIRRSRMPLRFSKFSNHIYNNHIHLTLLALKELSGFGYQPFMEWVENFPQLWSVLGIDRIPHFTTLHKFSGRIDRRYLDMLLEAFIGEFRITTLETGIDSTGLSITNASFYYTNILEKRSKKKGRPKKRRAIKRHIKMTFIVETRKQIILAVQIRRGPENDNKDFKPGYKKVGRIRGKRLKMVTADKGYDSEENHRFIREDMHADTIIPPRKNRSEDFKTRGKYRREMRKGYSKKKYNMRNINETVNSVVKRKMGSHIKARTCKYQNREVYFKVFAYNLNRVGIILLIFEGFLASR